MPDINNSLSNTLKDRATLLADYRNIKEADWWRLCKFPVLVFCVVLTRMYSPPEWVAHNVLLIFFIAAWFDMSMQVYRVNRKLEILHKIESSKGIQE